MPCLSGRYCGARDYKDTHAMVYEAMRELFSRHEPIDILPFNLLDERKQLETIGGRTYLIHLANTVPTKPYCAMPILVKHLARLITAASDIAEMGYHEEEKVEELLTVPSKNVCRITKVSSPKLYPT